MCTTTSHWATHISSECSLGGSAQCDGFCATHGVECTCSCHGEWDLPISTMGVRIWHDEAEGVVASFPSGPVDPEVSPDASACNEAMAYGKAMKEAHPDKEYHVAMGQGRAVVVERYL